jgi:hypothetical protein
MKSTGSSETMTNTGLQPATLCHNTITVQINAKIKYLSSTDLLHFFHRRLYMFLVERDYMLIYNRSCVGLVPYVLSLLPYLTPSPPALSLHSIHFGDRTAPGLAIKIRFPAQATHRLFSQAASGSGPTHIPSRRRPGGEDDHLNPSSAVTKNERSYISTPPHALLFILFYFTRLNIYCIFQSQEYTGTTYIYIYISVKVVFVKFYIYIYNLTKTTFTLNLLHPFYIHREWKAPQFTGLVMKSEMTQGWRKLRKKLHNLYMSVKTIKITWSQDGEEQIPAAVRSKT